MKERFLVVLSFEDREHDTYGSFETYEGAKNYIQESEYGAVFFMIRKVFVKDEELFNKHYSEIM